MALVRKLETGDKFNLPKASTFKLNKPGYQEEFEYDEGKLLENYESLASEYNITDPEVRKYYKQLVEAAKSGNLINNGDGTLKVLGDYADLRNLYDDISQVSDLYKNKNNEFGYGVLTTLNEVNAKSHGIFTTKGTTNFRKDQHAKALAAGLFLKGLDKSIYQPEPEKPKDKYDGAKYKEQLLALQLGGDPSSYTSLTREQQLKILNNLLEDALHNAETFYNAHDWTDLGNITYDDWVKRLQDAKTGLENGIDESDNLAWALLGFGPIYLKLEALPVDLSNPLSLTREQYINEKLAEMYKLNPSLQGDEALKAKLIQRYGEEWDDQKNNIVTEQDTYLGNLEFDRYYNNYNDYTLPDNPSGIIDLLQGALAINQNIQDINKAGGRIGIEGQMDSFATTDLADLISNIKLLFRNTVMGDSDLSHGSLQNTAYLLNYLYKIYTNVANALQQDPTSLPNGKVLYDLFLNQGLFLFDPENNTIIIKNRAFTNGEDKGKYYLMYDLYNNKFSYIKESEIEGDSHKDRILKEWKKKKLASSMKEGGIIKYEIGGQIDDSWINSYVNNIYRQEEAVHLYLQSKQGDKRQVGSAWNSTQQTVGKDIDLEWKNSDKVRIAGAVADLSSLVASLVGASPVALGTGLAGTAAQAYSDFSDTGFNWGNVGSTALNLGLDVLTAVPGLGAAAKLGKIKHLVKTLNVIKYPLMAYTATRLPEAYDSVKLMFTDSSKMTVGDWKNAILALNTVTAIAGGHIKSKNPNAAILSRKGVEAAARPGKGVPFYEVTGADGSKINLSPKDWDKLLSKKTLEELQEALAKMTEVGLNTPIGERAKELLTEVMETSWLGLKRNGSLSRSFNPFTLDEISIYKPGVRYKYFKPKAKQKTSEPISDSPKSNPKLLPEGKATLPKIKETPEVSTKPNNAEPKVKVTAESEVKVTTEPEVKVTTEPITVKPELKALPELHTRKIKLLPAPTLPKVPSLVESSLVQPKLLLNLQNPPKNTATLSKNKLFVDEVYKRFVELGKKLDVRFRVNKSALKSYLLKDGSVLNIMSLLSKPNLTRGELLEFRKAHKFKDGGSVLKFDEGGPLWAGSNYYGDFNLLGLPEDYISEYNNRAAKSIGTTINNNWHKNGSTYLQRNALNQYYTGGSYDTRKNDLIAALLGYAIPLSTAESLMAAYNEDMEKIRQYLSKLHKYNDSKASEHNKRHKRLFSSLNAKESLGYDSAQEDTYGPTSYLRIGDFYDAEYGNDLSDLEFLNRTFLYDLNGTPVLYGKKANGDITTLTPELIERYNKLKNPSTKSSKSESDPEKPTQHPEVPKSLDAEDLLAILQSIDLDAYKKENDPANKKSKGLVRPDKVLAATRLINLLYGNKLSLNDALNYHSILGRPYTTLSNIYGLYRALKEDEYRRGQAYALVNHMLDANAGNKLRAMALTHAASIPGTLLALAMDAERLHQTEDIALNHANANKQRSWQSNLQNVTVINNDSKEHAEDLGRFHFANTDSINNYLLGDENEFKLIFAMGSLAKNSALRNKYSQDILNLLDKYINVATPDYAKYKKESARALQEYLDEFNKQQHNYSSVYFDNFSTYSKRGSKLSYKHRAELLSAKDFNKALQEDKKYLKEAAQFNHKNRKK